MDFILPISIYIYEKMFFNSQQTTFANTLIWELAIRFTYQKEEQLPLKKKITNDMSALVLCFWNFWIKSIPWKHNSRQSPLKDANHILDWSSLTLKIIYKLTSLGLIICLQQLTSEKIFETCFPNYHCTHEFDLLCSYL